MTRCSGVVRKGVRNWALVGVALAAMVPGLGLELGWFVVVAPALRALIFGVAIVGAAFLLSWAADVLQIDVSQGLALGLLAPVGFICWLRWRKPDVELETGHGLELVVLLGATIYAFTMPFRGQLSLLDMAFMGAIFLFYIWHVAKLPSAPPDLFGPAAAIGALSRGARRAVTAALALAAVTILFVAESFADALVGSGEQLGVDEFLLVQWLAPLASEAPELVVVALFAWRGATGAAMGTLVSSKINQWTLLVGTLPLVFAVSLGAIAPLPLDGRQREELFLTAAQTFCAVVMLLDLKLHWLGALGLFGLFVAQFFIADHLVAFAAVYVVLGLIAWEVQQREIRRVLGTVRRMLRQVSG
jgi:cation:H+ antiporter